MSNRVINLTNDQQDDAIYIGRAVPRRGMKSSPFANPYRIGPDGDRAAVLARYRQHLRDNPKLVEQIRRELPGKRVACWCSPESCHGDIIVAVADGEEP